MAVNWVSTEKFDKSSPHWRLNKFLDSYMLGDIEEAADSVDVRVDGKLACENMALIMGRVKIHAWKILRSKVLRSDMINIWTMLAISRKAGVLELMEIPILVIKERGRWGVDIDNLFSSVSNGVNKLDSVYNGGEAVILND